MDNGNSPLPDILNDIFLLDLDWDYRGDATLRKEDLLAFRDLCRELQKHLMTSEFHSAVWFLTQARHFIRGELPAERLFQPLVLSVKQRQKIADLLSRGSDLFLHELTRLVSTGLRLPELFARENAEEIFAAFLAAEKQELRAAGLNQRSVSIVLNRLEAHKDAVVRNVVRDRSVIQNVLSRNLSYLDTLSQPPVAIYGEGRKADRALQSSRRRLIASKDKVVGFATLWADALPVMIAGDWGIAGVMSTVAGATVAAVLPRSGDPIS